MTVKTIAVAAALLLATGCGGDWAAARETTQGGPKTMNDAQDKAAKALELKDDEYFGLDQDRTTALSLKLSGLFPKGPARLPKGPNAPPIPPESFLVVGAPRTVPLDRRHEIPILIGSRYTDQREWEVHREQNSVVVAADLKTGEVRTGWPFLMGKRRLTPPPSGTGAAPDAASASSISTGVERVDLRELFAQTWPSTRLAVSVIDYDWVSNVVVVSIEKEGPPPAEAKPRKPSAFLSASAAPPAGPGASLVVPAKAAKGAPLTLKGALDLEADRVAVAPMEGAPDVSLALASLIFRKLDNEDPVQIDVAVRAQIADEKGTKRVRAGFEFDAWKTGGNLELEGSYQVYFAAGAVLAGPYPLTIGP